MAPQAYSPRVWEVEVEGPRVHTFILNYTSGVRLGLAREHSVGTTEKGQRVKVS